MKPLYNVSVRTKLLVYAAIIIILILTLAGFALYQIYIIQNRMLPARAAARKMETSLLTLRSNEQQFINEASSLNTEFYLRHQSNSMEAWQESYRSLEQNYNTLLSFHREVNVDETLQQIKPKTVQYRDAFLELASTYQQRGFQAYGREGVLQQRADALQTDLAAHPQQGMLLLEIRHAQDKFLLHKDMTAVATFNDNALRLKSQLVRNEDRIALDEYMHIFQDVVTLDQKIGLTATNGLRGKLNSLMGDIIPYTRAAETSVLDATTDRIQAISRSIFYTTIIVVALAIALALIIGRLIARRLQELSEASRRVAGGNFSYRLPEQTTDELGQLAHSFNTMTAKLQQNQKVLHGRAHDLAQSVRRFELVSKAVNEAIYEWDIEKGTLRWGEGLVSLFGYAPKEKETTIDWWAQRIHPEDTEKIDTSLAEHLRRHASTWKKVYRFKKANGQYVYCRDQGFIEYHGDKAIRMVGSIVDITHQKELERAKDEFISIASHQLRTPLGSIRWNLDLLMDKKDTLPAEIADYVQEAYKSTARMLALVSDLLSVARIEQNRVQDIPVKTNLVPIILAAADEMKPLAIQEKVKIKSEQLKKKTVEAVIDPKLFREVIQNLLSNAVKYSPAGVVTLTIEPKAKDVVIGVADTGVGIPIEDQPNLFSKFFRASNVTTTNTEGSGLGLFVVKSYVDSWGGKIWFVSEAEKGTTFYVSIPYAPRVKSKTK